jgi:hypothetical protein
VIFTGLLVAGAIVRPDDASLGTALMIAAVVPLGFAVVSRRSKD